MLTIFSFLWGDKYGPEYVERLAAGLKKNLHQEHDFTCILDEKNYKAHKHRLSKVVSLTKLRDEDLCREKGCFARLRIFDQTWTDGNRFADWGEADDRVVCIDLDSVITGSLDKLFNRPENFVILQGANAKNPCPYNGSLWMIRSGYRPDVWSDFSLEAAAKIPFYEFPDDQAWLAAKLPDAAGWNCGPQSGVYAFQKPQWPKGDDLPADARLVVFPGHRDPSKFTHLDWVKQNWAA